MKYGVLGTGDVARTIANKLIKLGHEVMMGSRSENNPAAVLWAEQNGERALYGTFATERLQIQPSSENGYSVAYKAFMRWKPCKWPEKII